MEDTRTSFKLLKEYSKKENWKEFKITIAVRNSFLSLLIKEGTINYVGQYDLNDLKKIDKYFRMYDKIEDAYKELITSLNENQYNIKTKENNLILSIEIEYNHKKNSIPFILQKNAMNKDELIKSLYTMSIDFIRENNGLKEDINNLNTKIDRLEEKIDIILNYIGKNFVEKILEKSKIVENKEQISLLKSWLPFPDKDNLQCKLIYDARRDGDKVSIFHSLCDNKPATLTIILTSDDKKIGGFLLKPFGGNKGLISDSNAFLFSLNYNEQYPSLNKGKNYDDQKDKGPIFGSYCINIEDNFMSNNKNYYHPYTCRYDFGNRNSNTEFYFKVIDLEVYQIFE